jgi:RNA polymerase sigma factor FliA
MSYGVVDPDLQAQWSRWLNRQDAVARDQLIVHYSPLVKFVAGRVGAGLPANVEAGDLVSAGIFGLIDAIERYEPDRQIKFETFAAPRIRGAIYDGLRELDWVPRSVRRRAREVQEAFAHLEGRTGTTPDDEDLAAHLGISTAELAKWLSSIAATTVGPLDRAIEMGHEPPADPTPTHSPIRAMEDRETRAAMRSEIRSLPDREKLVLSLYYDEGLTLSEIADVLGVTESRVSQIHTKAVLHLRSRMSASGLI